MDIRFFPDATGADLAKRFRYAEVCAGGVHDRGTYAVGSSFAALAATHCPEGPRHMSVGRFLWMAVRAWHRGRHRGQRGLAPEMPCYLPWTFVEIEGTADLWEAAEATRSLLEEMRADGINTEAMHLRYSGNASLWICIPAALMGHPVGSVSDQKALRQRVFQPYTRRPLDEGLFDARHLHRLLGSTHEKGTRTRVLPIRCLEGRRVFEGALTGPDQTLPPTRRETCCGALLRRCQAKTTFHVPDCGEVRMHSEGGTFMRDTAEGVGKGARNETAFKRACVLWRRYSRRDAWVELEDWNAKNNPPLPPRELEQCFESARRKAQG